MIYLLQDCYKDDKGEYHDILKIGYSKDSFSRNRQGQYNTHNFGYKFLGEREGSSELENYLHKLLKEYNLDREWFRYSQEVIDKFWKVKEEDISDFSSQDELNEYIRDYILKHLVPSVDKFKKLYLNQILSEIKEKDTEYKDNKDIYKRNIIDVFEFISTREYEYFNNLDFNSKENIKILKKCNLIFPQNKSNLFRNNILVLYKIIRKIEIKNKEVFNKILEFKRNESKRLLDGFSILSLDEQQSYVYKFKASIEISGNKRDFISISKKTGLPIYNSLIDILTERSWEMAQIEYQDKLNIINPVKILFKENSNHLDVSKVGMGIQKSFNTTSDSVLYNTIYTKFKCGERYTSKDLKEILREIYQDLGISRTPKANDLGQYFKLIKTKITLLDKTLKDGFRLDPLG